MTIAALQTYKRILILGAGIEGQASLAFLKKYVPKSRVDTADRRDGPRYLEKQLRYDLIIKTPGIPKEYVTRPYTTATNIFFANATGVVIGVTGSKGKSTTASLIYDILKEAGRKAHLVGNIGNPALSELLQVNTKEDVYVYELSSYQLDDILYSPHISVITNFFPEHMDYHGSLAVYWEAKKKIIAHAKRSDYLVYHPRYPRLAQLAKKTKAIAMPGVADLPFADRDIPLLGGHNKENVQLAVAAARILEIDDEVTRRAVIAFTPLPHRLQNAGTYKEITFYDDAISTTPQSAIRAMEVFPNIGAMLLGGKNRGYDFSALAHEIARRKIPVLVLFPDSGAAIVSALKQSGYAPVAVLETSDMSEAVQFVYSNAPHHSICLLSTASPSYSIWKNFEEKGDLFQMYVKKFGEQL